MIDKRIKVHEKYIDKEIGTTTCYFSAEKSLLEELFPGKYPEAISMEISVEFPSGCSEPNYADVSISPVNANGEAYDWIDIDISYEEIDVLINMGLAA